MFVEVAAKQNKIIYIYIYIRFLSEAITEQATRNNHIILAGGYGTGSTQTTPRPETATQV
jgi:hypothetical protein